MSDSGLDRSPGTLASLEPSAITTHCSSGPHGKRDCHSRGSTSQPGRFAASACSTVNRAATRSCGSQSASVAAAARSTTPGRSARRSQSRLRSPRSEQRRTRSSIHGLPPQLIGEAAGEGVTTNTDGARGRQRSQRVGGDRPHRRGDRLLSGVRVACRGDRDRRLLKLDRARIDGGDASRERRVDARRAGRGGDQLPHHQAMRAD